MCSTTFFVIKQTGGNILLPECLDIITIPVHFEKNSKGETDNRWNCLWLCLWLLSLSLEQGLNPQPSLLESLDVVILGIIFFTVQKSYRQWEPTWWTLVRRTYAILSDLTWYGLVRTYVNCLLFMHHFLDLAYLAGINRVWPYEHQAHVRLA